MEEDFEIMPNLLDRRRLKDRIIENISKAVKNVRFWLTFQELEVKNSMIQHSAKFIVPRRMGHAKRR